MLRPHSLLWHYLWLGPNVLRAVLAMLLQRRGLHKQFPAFFVYLVYGAIEQFTLWTLDVLPLSFVGVHPYWRAFFVGIVIEDFTKLAVIWGLFTHLVSQRPSISKSGIRWIVGVGATLGALALLVVRHTPVDPRTPTLVFRAQLFEMAGYIVFSGLMLFLFIFAARRGLTWGRRHLGIALGLGIAWCELMAAWGIGVNRVLGVKSFLLDFVGMGTYHICVLLWFYYFLSPVPRIAGSTDDGISLESEEGHANSLRWQRLQPAWFLARSKSLP
jgi:hypothetical protein